MKIFVAQFYTENVQYGRLAEEINRKYCLEKGYTYVCETGSAHIREVLGDRAPTWYKPKFILEVFEKYDPDYVLFLDIDAVVIDFHENIETFISKDHDIVFTEDYSGHSRMNAGVCIVKNTNWTKQFMKQWWDAGETFKGGDATIYNVPEEHKEIVGYYKNAIWHDQTCLTILYDRHADVRNLIKIIPYRRLNWNVPDGNPFVFHAFAFGSLPLRTIDGVYARTFGIPPDTSSLKSLAAIYPTDRDHRHDFFKVYDPLFCRMKDIKNLIEVGWWDGNSLEIWSRYFPKAKIWCVDAKAPDYNNEIGNIQTLKIDNRNADELEAYGKSVSDIDVIVDDASHSMKDQQTIFGKLFKSLKSGGVFIIEDLHSSVECRMPGKEWCNWGDPTKTTTLDVLNLYNETGKIQSDYLTVEQCEYLENNIASCEILTGHVESLTSIIKKK